MPYYRTCPDCGCSLDPGEICDCGKEEAAPDAANIQSGKVKVIDQTTFTSDFNKRLEENQQ